MVETDNVISTVALNITRSGSFGTATITWSISASASTPGASVADIGVSAGQVVIPNGANRASFQFSALADDTPEIDEQFLITLIAVNEANQMILSGQVT